MRKWIKLDEKYIENNNGYNGYNEIFVQEARRKNFIFEVNIKVFSDGYDIGHDVSLISDIPGQGIWLHSILPGDEFFFDKPLFIDPLDENLFQID